MLKKNSAKLASELSQYYIMLDSGVPDIIDTWKKVCQSVDEFYEIKNQWKG